MIANTRVYAVRTLRGALPPVSDKPCMEIVYGATHEVPPLSSGIVAMAFREDTMALVDWDNGMRGVHLWGDLAMSVEEVAARTVMS